MKSSSSYKQLASNMSTTSQYNNPNRSGLSTISRNLDFYLIISQLENTAVQNQRIFRISEKINGIQSNIENEKFSRLQQLDAKINNVDERLLDTHELNMKKFNAFRDQLSKVQKFIEQDKQQKQSSAEMRHSEYKILETKIFQRFQAQAVQRKQLEKRLFLGLEEKTSSLRGEIVRQAKNRYDSIQNIRLCLQNDIPKLQESLKTQAIQREQMDSSILKKVTDEMGRLQGIVLSQKKARQQTEQALLEMLRDMVKRINTQIETERRDRQASVQTLLNLLDETCNKLNNAANL